MLEGGEGEREKLNTYKYHVSCILYCLASVPRKLNKHSQSELLKYLILGKVIPVPAQALLHKHIHVHVQVQVHIHVHVYVICKHVYKHYTQRGHYCARIDYQLVGGSTYIRTSGCCGCSSIGPLATVFCFFFLNRLLMVFSPRANIVGIQNSILDVDLSKVVIHGPKSHSMQSIKYM